MSNVKDFQKWINEVMPKIIGNLGLDVNKTRYKIHDFNGIFIMSKLYNTNLQFENKSNGQNEELSIVLKRPMLGFSQFARVDLHFHNEILFYQMYAQPNDIFARCFYFEERPPTDSVIALENVNKRGYYSCPYVYDPPLEYTLAAMRELGRFHGKGYIMKKRQREKFFDIVARIQEVRFVKRMNNIYEFNYNLKSLRAVEYLRRHGYDAIFCDKMEIFLSNAFENVMIKTVQPLEPLATLCHGDLTLGNILFKTEDDGQYRSMLIDFAVITYSTPVVDLSTYLYTCCSNEMRKNKFFEIMRAYHDALKEYLLDAGIQNIDQYSYDALLDDFKRGALYGFVIMCAFVPVLLGHLKAETIVQDVINLGPLKAAEKQKYVGGDEVSKILAEALLHLKDFGCLKHIL